MANLTALPLDFNNKDGILFCPMDDLTVFLNMTSTTDMSYNSEVQVTTSPVMSGANVADNWSLQPKRIDINGVVVAEYTGVFLISQSTGTVEDFVSTVETWRKQKRLVKVICKDGISLDNCVIQNFQARKEKSISNGLNVSMSFVQIDIVTEALRTTVTGSVTSNANGSPAGAKTTVKGVQGLQQAGKASTTETTSTLNCKALLGQSEAWLTAHQSALSARNSCQQSAQKGAAHGQYIYTFSPSDQVMSEVKNSLDSQAVNHTMKAGN